jgi:hypothetical protein
MPARSARLLAAVTASHCPFSVPSAFPHLLKPGEPKRQCPVASWGLVYAVGGSSIAFYSNSVVASVEAYDPARRSS